MTTFAVRMAEMIAVCHPKELDGLSKLMWQGYSSADLTDSEATALSDAIQGRREARQRVLSETRLTPRPYRFHRAPPQRSPDRQRSMERRRRLAASGPLPPVLAALFTTGELAVLRIVGDEVRANGLCDRTVPELAARAGVSMSTVRNAIRSAGRENLLIVQARPRPGRKNLSNIVRIISREWSTWLARGKLKPASAGGAATPFKNSKATDIRFSRASKAAEPPERADAVERGLAMKRSGAGPA